MPGKTPRDAAQALVTALQESASCVTDGKVEAWGEVDPDGAPLLVLLSEGRPTAMKGSVLVLGALQEVRLVESASGVPWTTRTASYRYSILTPNEQELFLFDWHPERRGMVSFPHLHVSGEAPPPVGRDLSKLQLPTGRVAFEQVVRFAITALAATPRRSDWSEVLDRNQRLFEATRTW